MNEREACPQWVLDEIAAAIDENSNRAAVLALHDLRDKLAPPLRKLPKCEGVRCVVRYRGMVRAAMRYGQTLYAVHLDDRPGPCQTSEATEITPDQCREAGCEWPWDEETPKFPHHISCNYQRSALGEDGCICEVVNKHAKPPYDPPPPDMSLDDQVKPERGILLRKLRDLENQ